jgi:phage tail-like protein
MPQLGPNAALGFMSTATGVRLDPYHAFNFVVEVEGLLTGAFSECTGLQVETETLEYREGGVNDYVHRLAGPTKHPPLVLKHGLTAIDGLWEWHQEVTRGNVRRRNGTIYLLDKAHLPVLWWDFREAFPVRWSGPDLRADGGQIAFESIELAHRGLGRPTAAGAVAGAAAAIAGALGF